MSARKDTISKNINKITKFIGYIFFGGWALLGSVFYLKASGNEQKLLTYDGLSSIEECLKQFDWWQEEYGYKIKTACVQIIKDGGTVENRCYESKWAEIENKEKIPS